MMRSFTFASIYSSMISYDFEFGLNVVMIFAYYNTVSTIIIETNIDYKFSDDEFSNLRYFFFVLL